MRRVVGLALRLGRTSNLPTVWTNVLVGITLGGAVPTLRMFLPLALALSLFYVAGMFLNDAFDRGWDARHRPERPIPAGEVRAGQVFGAGFGLLGAGLLILLAGPGGARAGAAGLALAALIVAYDACHKANAGIAAALMALCRVGVYLTAARGAGTRLTPPLAAAAGVLLVYLIALSLIARREGRDPRLPRLVGLLIAGICLLDGALLAWNRHGGLAALCAVAFLLTRRLQRRIAAT